ncbi:MAG TPA: DUF2007 domain-containing protein [Gemmatimonadaceae bacterium]|nr:DUF2007 domain-containing protein [Gemmatimonadaceae bacterium]
MSRDESELTADGLYVIRTFSTEVEASLAEAVLEAHGIDSSVMADNAAGVLPYLNTLHPLRLVVRGEDVAAAIALLDSNAPEPPQLLDPE